ncbi:DUF3367 domain-containing protein [Rhodococcus triatomae]|uniref:alpha-(1->3)-arabinofuranosyltransferase n=1 Tax=Rhodococcus triatomae TaxID=300028 RepID=UPI0009334230|nr:alpha-(1->3)-arabinofuranosyltransferase [Rhodococcus triatomae]QNG21516.1 DUF3367 domain-containing protein [Rhodococcus triatomae]QNG25745.1 DUF3367 domain-containing protein [Rhodococcus triatomae]
MSRRSPTDPLSRRWLFAATALAFVLSFLQSPGLIAADTKYDLTENPLGFLGRAAHLWSSQAPMGQVQNQAYGYFFPHGAFFALGDLAHVPAWITQRLWWALVLVAGFWGVIRLAEALGIGSRSSRIIAAVAFALSPRVLTTLGSISSETLPMMLAPWVLLPLVYVTRPRPGAPPRSLPRLAAQSALAVALMGAVNAVATLLACLVAGLWWIAHRPNRRWWVFTAWWIPCLVAATVWWVVPLLLLGRVSPPFLDYIESSGVTTQWTSLAEVLRGTGSWTPFVSPERIAGAVLVTQPAVVVATGLIAAAGLAGLAMRSMPARGRLVLILMVGIAGLAVGYAGELASPVADQVRMFLDGAGAPLRNVHKLEPLVRLPLVLGLAHLLAKVPLPGSVPGPRWRSALAHPEREPMVAVTTALLIAITLTTSLAWTGKLAPRGAYAEVPGHWHEAARWLEENTRGDGPGDSDTGRALVVPGAPFGDQVWGLTRDEPLQALADTPWAVRDSVPLTPPGTIRALDSVQRLIADGRPSDGLAATLLGQGVHYLVVRNDLHPDTSRSPRPILVHQAIEGSPGLTKVAEFGEDIGPEPVEDLVRDGDLRPAYPAIEIFRVELPGTAGTVAPGPYTVDAATVPRVQGGPESVQRLHENGAVPGPGPVLLAADAERAGLPVDSLIVTDTPRNRETDYGQVDNHSSGLRAPDDPRRTHNLVADYPVPDTPLVEGEWEGARVSVSSSAADATQLGGTSPGSGAAAVVDGDTATGWFSNVLHGALGQWVQFDLDTPVSSGVVHVTTSPAALGPAVRWMELSTANGTTAVRVDQPGEPVTVALPGGTTDWFRITATRTADGSGGVQFGVGEIAIEDFGTADAATGIEPQMVPVTHRTVLPPTPPGAQVTGWDLSQELPGRAACVEGPDRVRCGNAFAMPPEEGSSFTRTLSVPDAATVTPQLTVRARPGAPLEDLLARDAPTARGRSDLPDLRGGAYAATDGDPRTSWTAARDTVGGRTEKPTLTIELPAPTEVTGLELTASPGDLPATAQRVAVDLGNGTQVRDVGDDGIVELAPYETDRIVLSIVSWDELYDAGGFGLTRLPAGLAEVGVLGADGQPLPGSGVLPESEASGRIVSVGCDAGPVLSIGGHVVRTQLSATVGELLSGAPVVATACDDASAPLPSGRVDVAADPTSAFVVDSLRLPVLPEAPQAADRSPVTATAWTDSHREVTLAPADGSGEDRLLVVPESTNIGWVATTEDGTELSPVVVNGWQQGWVVPAGATGTVTLDYPLDRWYRTGIFGGLLLLLPLALLALWPTRCAPREFGPAPRPWRSTTAAWLGVLATATVAAGVTGAVIVLLGTAGALGLARWRGPATAARTLVGVAGVATTTGMLLLSTGPWRGPDGYVGHSWLIQFAVLTGLVAAGLAVVPLGRSARRAWRRWTSRRDGSSISA